MKRIKYDMAGSCAVTVNRQPVVEALIAAALTADAALERERDLSPANPLINAVLSRLVGLAGLTYTPAEERAVLADERIRRLRERLLGKLSIAEGALEHFYAERLGRQPALTLASLGAFPYYANYEALLALELRHLQELELLPGGGAGMSAVFVGSGPLPLSAILLQAATGVQVVCVDNNRTACVAAQRLLARLGLEDALPVVHAAGEAYDYGGHALALVASLVADKRAVARQIRVTRPGAALAVRSAEGVRTLLYEPVDEAGLEGLGCRKLGQSSGNGEVINSTLFYRLSP
ncbi:nicotianamine synthase [Paenibacillus athensensis]|uniref:Nicotianamine synthase n=1 Tax=Paenibacillus athensensis TaxID=1967502 RepID=A0A4Y8Q3P4_9BACL|nr:nicotianamine synthase family protein [Paenibacillus athensensis]MCD1258347.1 nicotianamine synthase [Paenibacillus athensensis]